MKKRRAVFLTAFQNDAVPVLANGNADSTICGVEKEKRYSDAQFVISPDEHVDDYAGLGGPYGLGQPFKKSLSAD